ncbi:hypothetical protein QRX50_00310 [Amycolatopsis carbonis]|uniref:Uncharacterized protein n=1 Tax=Amycolatopsis carbonis TaxID=715471 RepID=A0A9Y2IFV2_9PSEU|nr:hypothetical protein [Amycolatopsis sp. 2-15]WIX79297.1 hypothetical protein QRX50_00310 [Amycolatopsis sp. 2-15]
MSFEERLAALVGRLGVAPRDLDDGHARWAVYAEAVGRAEEWPAVLDLIEDEPDLPVAAAVVVRALDVLPEAQRADFVAALPEGRSREFAATRARELVILDRVAAGDGPEFDVRRWTNWLQLRAATTINVEQTLEALSSSGATRRIRSAAAQRLRVVRGAGS